MTSRVIKSQTDYEGAMARLEELVLLDPAEGTPARDELELLALLVGDYESRMYELPAIGPIDALKFRMEQLDLKARDLVPYLGGRGRVSEVLAGRRPLTLTMIRALHLHLGVPARILLQERDPRSIEESPIEWERFPVKEMADRGWLDTGARTVRDHAEDLIRDFIRQLGSEPRVHALYRMSGRNVNSARQMDEVAIFAWTVRVLIRAKQSPPPKAYKAGIVNLKFMSDVARLSWSERGPLLAQEYLRNNGIVLVIERHLPRTHLDGAAMLLDPETAVIGLTLRYDRIDNFWFCLMHELAHLALHMNTEGDPFYDDLDLEVPEDPREKQANQLGSEALIPAQSWERSAAHNLRSPEAAEVLAHDLGIHPAIVAGRMRHHFKAYRLLNHLVGLGKVRQLFEGPS